MDDIANVRWSPDGTSMSYLAREGGVQHLWRVFVADRRSSPIPIPLLTAGETEAAPVMDSTGHRSDCARGREVLAYEWSPDGRTIGVATASPDDSSAIAEGEQRGIVYDLVNLFRLEDLVAHRWSRPSTELWLCDTVEFQARQVLTASAVSDLAWSPDGSALAVSYNVPRRHAATAWVDKLDIGVVTVSTGRLAPVATSDGNETRPRWSPDGRRLAFLSRPQFQGASSIGVVDVLTGSRHDVAVGSANTFGDTPDVWWAPDGRQLLFTSGYAIGRRRERVGLYSTPAGGGAVQRVTPVPTAVSDCDAWSNGQLACVSESSTAAPAPALVQLGESLETDVKVRPVAAINPELDSVRLAEVTEWHWHNVYTDETNGYLIRPLDYRPNMRYPLVIIVRGFEGKFTGQAELMSSYPAQAFARDGFVVLMANFPVWADWHGRDVVRGTRAVGYSPLASIASAVRRLARQGLIDPTRVGMMGLSSGAFWTDFTITHSSLIRAASVMDGAGYNPGQYWIVGDMFAERVLGGPPDGPTLGHWLKFSPVWNATRVSCPVLMEFNGNEAAYGLELAAALRRHGKAVEFVVYPNDGHVFRRPNHRFYSMQRNLNWFNFWLRGVEPHGDAASADLASWHAMRSNHARLVSFGRTTGR